LLSAKAIVRLQGGIWCWRAETQEEMLEWPGAELICFHIQDGIWFKLLFLSMHGAISVDESVLNLLSFAVV
jgi:hypothetical protein